MKQLRYFTIVLLCSCAFLSCNRVKKKAKQITHKVKVKTTNTLKDQSKKVVDKVFPPFDHDKADTENNKKRFADFLKVERTLDVKNIYCYDDAIGVDADYMFSFHCNAETSAKIIKKHQLKLDKTNTDNAFSLQDDFNWWDKKRIQKLPKHSWTNGKKYHKYYWYDVENETAYFFDFTL